MISTQNISPCCLKTEGLPEAHSGNVTFEAIAFDAANFGAEVMVIIKKEGIEKRALWEVTLSGAGALTLDLTGGSFFSRYAGEYQLEVFRRDNGARVEFRENPGEDVAYPGLCFCAMPCEIPVPTDLLVRAFSDACPVACTPCPC